MAKKKVQIQLLDTNSGAVIEDVDPLTSADAVTFSDGETFQQKYDAGKLRGQTGPAGPQGEREATGTQGPRGLQGIQGATGPQGPQGAKGDKGDTGETVRVGTAYASAQQVKLFFKVIT